MIELQNFIELGDASLKKHDYNNGIKFASGWQGEYMWVYMENMTDQNRHTLLKITIAQAINLEIMDKKQNNQIWLKAGPNQKVAGCLKKIDPLLSAQVKQWTFDFEHFIENEDLVQIFKDLGKTQLNKTIYPDGLTFTSGWYLHDKCYVWIENTNQQRTSSVTITYEQLLNLKLSDFNKTGDIQHTLVAKPGEIQVSWVEKITKDKAQILKWKFQIEHQMIKSIKEIQQKSILDQQIELMENEQKRASQRSIEQTALVKQIDLNLITGMTIQQDLKWIEMNNQVTDVFVDPEFKHNIQSLSKNDKAFHQKFEKAVWLRPIDIFKCDHDQIKLFDGIDCNDIQQGALGVCYLLSNICAMTEFPQTILRIFNSRYYNPKGMYSITLFHMGNPKEIIVDDYFPCYQQGQTQTIFCHPVGKEIWVMVLEKAWAKYFGDYRVAEAMHIDESAKILLGVPTLKFKIENWTLDDLYQKVLGWDKQNAMMGICSKQDVKKEDGIVASHAYTLINVYSIEGHEKIYKLRNPWGYFEFKNGKYSDENKIWKTDQKLAEQLEFQQQNDGIFHMTGDEILNYFTNISIAFYDDKFELQTFQVNDQYSQCYEITVIEQSKLAINTSQVHQKLRVQEDPNWKYCRSNIILKLSDSEFVNSEDENKGLLQSYFSHNLSKNPYVDLTPGTYLVNTSVEFKGSDPFKNYGVSFYGTPSIEIHPCDKYDQVTSSYLLNLGKNLQKSHIGSKKYHKWAWNGPSIFYIIFENQNQHEDQMTVTFEELDNLYIVDFNGTKKGDMTMVIKAEANSSAVGYLKRPDVSQQCLYKGYKFH